MEARARKWSLRLVLVLLSSTAAVVVGWWVLWAPDREAPSVELVDRTKVLSEVLLARQQEPGPASTVYPPPLVREELDVEILKLFFPQVGVSGPTPEGLFYARKPNLKMHLPFAEHPAGGYELRTNSLGMREDADPSATPVSLRVIATGDSHLDGVCANAESVPNVLERLLRDRAEWLDAEVLNAGAGGYSFYNYLNVLECHAALEPDVFLCVCYGGNDFAAMLQMQRYFERRPPPVPRSQHRAQCIAAMTAQGLVSQELGQVIYFQDNPEDVPVAIDTCNAIAVEMKKLCDRSGIRLVFAYLPPHLRGQPAFFEAELRQAHELLRFEDEWVEVSDQIADRWLEFLRSRDIECVDLRPALRAAPELAYYRSDRHLNPYGNEVAARVLHDALF